MDQLTLSFFGTFQARLGDKPLSNFRSAKVQGLLIYLALTPQQAHDRNLLTAFFWPDEPEAVANHNLRQSLYRLRQLLSESNPEKEPLPQAHSRPYLLVTRTTVQFNMTSNTILDVADFLSHLKTDQPEQAVALYQGELLPGFGCNSLPFDEWLRLEREKLHRLALNAFFELTSLSLTRGDYHSAQRLARQQLTLESWREEAHQQLMQALVLSGDRSGALAQYETCRRVLKEELGIEPSAETKILATRIRDQQLDQQEGYKSDGLQEQRRLTLPFVGRHREVETLVNAYRQASRNTLQIVTLVGNAGIGKTRLAQHFIAWAAPQGADVLYSRSFETSGGLSYQPISHLLRQRLERENAPEDLLSDLWLSQLTRLLPELRERYPDLPQPTQEEATARQHLFEAVTRLGKALAERQPLVLLLDDWHWADSASLDMLYYASQRWLEEKVPILVLLTLRQEALSESPALQSWLNQLKRTASAVQLNLDELSQAETEQLVQVLLTPAGPATQSALSQFSHWLFTETDGQPLFLTEALKVLVEQGVVCPLPPSTGTGQSAWQLNGSLFDAQRSESGILAGVREIIQGWLTRISVTANKLLMASAVLAQAASFDNLCRVSGLDENQAVAALEELLKRQLLIEPPATQRWATDLVYTFSHQKVSEVVYAEAGTARRRMLHRRAFDILQTMAVPAAELAHHALAAGLPAETIHYSLLAGNEALALFASQVAITHYKTAFQVGNQKGWPETISGADRQALFTGLGRAYELSEQVEAAEELYKAMVAYARQVGAPAMECLGLNHLAELYCLVLFNPDKTFDVLGQAWLVAERTGDRRGMAETAQNLSFAAKSIHDTLNELKYAEQALALARELEHPALLARCLARLAYATIGLRDWEKAEQYATEAQHRFEEIGNLFLANNIQRVVGGCQLQNGRPQASLETHKKAYAFIQQVENAWEQAHVARFLAMAHAELGEYGQAIQLARESVALARKANHPLMALPLATYGIIQRAVLCLDEAQAAWLEIKRASEGKGFDPFPDQTLAELCAIHALREEWVQAHTYAKGGVAFQRGKSLPPMATTGWYETEALIRGGDGELARAEVERLARIVGNNHRYRLPLLRSQAVLAQWDGDVGQAISHLEAALALAQEIGLPGEEWSILGALGGLYAEQGEQNRAQRAYAQAGTIIHRLAATIDDEALREGFLSAVPVCSVLEMGTVI